ncbi:MAG: CPBP family intramembrane metalloprotease [Proteobacteria bacterium]|nr:MAG: CPBP family intramembrane metalloprotease [Pseudomonadota bacterium]
MHHRAKQALILFALIFPTLAVFTYFAGDPGSTKAWYTASKIVQFSLPFLGVAALGMHRRWKLKITPGELRLGSLSGLGILMSLTALYWFGLRELSFIGGTRTAVAAKLAEFGVSGFGGFLLLAAFISLAHSFLEEFYWRGFVFAELREWLGPKIAYPLAALGFTGHHVVVIARYAPADQAWLLVPIFSSFVFLAGWIWAAFFARRGSLIAAWISHFFADVAIMAIGGHLVFGGTP